MIRHGLIMTAKTIKNFNTHKKNFKMEIKELPRVLQIIFNNVKIKPTSISNNFTNQETEFPKNLEKIRALCENASDKEGENK